MKKPTKTRRDTRPRLNQSQLQAYRARKAETIIRPRTMTESDGSELTSSEAVTTWGKVADEYTMIADDLKRLLMITALMVVIMVVLWFILR